MTVQERINAQLVEWDRSLPPWHLLRYVTPKAFENPGMMHGFLLIMLDALRWQATRLAQKEIPIIITSDYRKGDDKTHGEQPCLGVDIRVRNSEERFYLLKAAFDVGFTRIGIYCDDHHLHVDIGDYVKGGKYPANTVWVRECAAP